MSSYSDINLQPDPLTGLPDVRLSAEAFLRLRDWLASFSGVYLDAAQQRMLEQGLSLRMAATGLNLTDYERQIAQPSGHDELRCLVEQVLNHETSFFRNGPHMRALREVVLPNLHRRKPIGEPIRIWSAGCASGEEPYSLAMMALEALGAPPARPVEVYATDLSAEVLNRARTGVYRGRTLNNVPPEMLDRYFTPAGESYTLKAPVRALVQFAQLNLLDPFPPIVQGVDAIFCQNVTIYFQAETRRRLIERFYACLPPAGMLFLGFSETLWNVFDAFHSHEIAGAYVYVKDQPLPRRAQTPARPPSAPPQPPRPAVRQRVSRVQHTPEQERPPDHRHDGELLAQAREHLEQGRPDAAIEVLRRVAPQSPLAARAMMLIAQAHADRGQMDLAIAEVRRALELDRLDEQAYVLLGTIYSREGLWNQAVQELERARYLNAGSPLVSFHLAAAYQGIARHDLAEREYRAALRKLETHASDALLDGVAVDWLRDTCRRKLLELADR